jgi:hypothetical protein
MKDDVDNQIRGVSYRSADVVNALDSGEEIQPGEQKNHLEVFSVPPPKTEYLLLTIDLDAFGKEGLVKFTIPRNAIQGFGS